MSDPILLKFAAGALRADDPGGIRVSWHVSSQEHGEGSLDEFASAYAGAAVTLVFSVEDFLLTSVALSRRQARHLNKVLPYLLEEQLIGDPENLWFSVGALSDGNYPALVCDRGGLVSLLARTNQLGLRVKHAAVDADLLRDRAPLRVLGEPQLLVIKADQAVSLPGDQLEALWEALELDSDAFATLDEEALWPALREGLETSHIELLHDELKPKSQRRANVARVPDVWRRFAMAASVMLVIGWTVAWLQAWQYSRLADQARSQAGALYQQLFPGDRATPRLSAQFSSRLAQLGAGGGGSGLFLSLMAPVTESLAGLKTEGVEPRRILFDERDNSLVLDLEAKNYEGLESLRTALVDAGLVAEIANFRNQGERVAARMKVNAS